MISVDNHFAFTLITKEYKVVRVWEFMMVWDLSDPVMNNALPEKTKSKVECKSRCG